ncbi:hypothetical protein DL770_007834 [Monosporascus sp. CRB-9-2]|nr:hypothetical protein DL770_007834 [Monosporascus sp. CRB-9-2]
MISQVLVPLTLAGVALGSPSFNVKRQITDLRESYDFIIAGAGTTGLTVADRLSAAFPDRTVLVVEYGDFDETPGTFDPPGGPPPAPTFGYSPVVPGLNNRTAALWVGRTVGGSSAVNGQLFDRGCRHDYDDWQALASPSSQNGIKWDWDGLLPYFRKKSVTFVEPTEEQVADFGITWDFDAAYGGSTPIFSTWPPFQWPAALTARNAWMEAGVTPRKECAAGDKDGICWVPMSQYPDTAKRSHAGLGHYLELDKRTNYDLLVNHKVTRVVYPGQGRHLRSPPEVEIRSLESGEVSIANAKLEVRSGIGPAQLLERAGIEVVSDLPGVGYNFQDHSGPSFGVKITNPPVPNPDMLRTNETYLQESIEAFYATPSRGPYTLGLDNIAVYLPLANITTSYKDIASSVRQQVASGEAASYLPAGASESVVNGYLAQLEILAAAFENPTHPIFEAPFQGPPEVGFLLKPLSRGSVLLDPDDHDAEPVITYGTLENPVDMDIMASFVPLMRSVYSTPTMRAMGVVETAPGAEVQDEEEIREWVRDATVASFQHPCCTAAMMPRELGGVVGNDLKVFGVEGLRVADASMMSLLPGTHTSATCYAIGEKAADIIIQAWS